MKRSRRTIAIVVGCVVVALQAPRCLAAGPYADELAKCLVKQTSEADKSLLVQWMFAMASLHPAVKTLSAMSEAQRTEITRGTAGMMERLLTVSCRSEAQQAMKYEGNSAIEAGFSVLGQVAARELFTNPQVAAGLADLEKFVDSAKLKAALQSGP